jgi:hypothetical protein
VIPNNAREQARHRVHYNRRGQLFVKRQLLATRCVNFRPCAESKTTFRFELFSGQIASTTSKIGSGFRTMPSPPPKVARRRPASEACPRCSPNPPPHPLSGHATSSHPSLSTTRRQVRIGSRTLFQIQARRIYVI